MITVRLGNVEVAPVAPHGVEVGAAAWSAPPVALAGTGLAALAADSCGPALALPASGPVDPVMRWRHESSRAVARFLDGLLAEKVPSDTTAYPA
jgi:hypothetical protein